jgi:hypothetical protein
MEDNEYQQCQPIRIMLYQDHQYYHCCAYSHHNKRCHRHHYHYLINYILDL